MELRDCGLIGGVGKDRRRPLRRDSVVGWATRRKNSYETRSAYVGPTHLPGATLRDQAKKIELSCRNLFHNDTDGQENQQPRF